MIKPDVLVVALGMAEPTKENAWKYMLVVAQREGLELDENTFLVNMRYEFGNVTYNGRAKVK